MNQTQIRHIKRKTYDQLSVDIKWTGSLTVICEFFVLDKI